ncbi:hypothetical protein MN608_09753 [Microdochium nivale]|nr:hypothetical protein MN608_09753 [Microdochium nivale]
MLLGFSIFFIQLSARALWYWIRASQGGNSSGSFCYLQDRLQSKTHESERTARSRQSAAAGCRCGKPGEPCMSHPAKPGPSSEITEIGPAAAGGRAGANEPA